MLDMYRQKLFFIRDELFDIAARKEHGLTFDNPAYVDLRNSLHNSIRFAHQISFYHVWIGSFLGAFSGRLNQMRAYKSKAALRIEGIKDNGLKECLEGFLKRQRSAVGLYMALRSPLFLSCVIVGGLIAALTILVKRGIFVSLQVSLRALEEQIKVKELDPSARAVQFQTDALNQDDDPDLCPA